MPTGHHQLLLHFWQIFRQTVIEDLGVRKWSYLHTLNVGEIFHKRCDFHRLKTFIHVLIIPNPEPPLIGLARPKATFIILCDVLMMLDEMLGEVGELGHSSNPPHHALWHMATEEKLNLLIPLLEMRQAKSKVQLNRIVTIA